MSIVAILCIALAVAVFVFPIVLIIAGAVQKRRATRPVSYYPPRGFSPIDVMCKYTGKKSALRNLFSATILYWAERGFITIEEDCKRGLKLTKLKDLKPPEHGAFDYETYRYELVLFDKMFEKSNDFYTLAATGAYKKDYDHFIGSCEGVAENSASPLSRRLSIISLISALVMLGAVTVMIGIYTRDAVMVASIFTIVGILFMRFGKSSYDGAGTAIHLLMYPFFAVWSGLPTTAILVIIPSDCAIAYAVAIVSCIAVSFVLSNKIDLRSAENIKYYGEIDAFKTFLVQAEKDKLETLVEEDPEYFYNILPYFYVLDITEKMKVKFDRVIMDGPSWYLGDLRDTLMF